MQNQIEQEYRYFRDAVFSVSRSLDLSRAMRSTFEFLSLHFPVVGLSFHVFRPERRAMHLLFLVTKDNFHYLDLYVDLPDKALKSLRRREKERKNIIIPHTFESTGASRTGKALDPYLPDKDRSRLNLLLASEDKIIGHFSLMGPDPECFTKADEQKLDILRPALSLFMMNLLRYQETEELKNRLAAENRQLASQVRNLKEDKIIGESGGLSQIMAMIQQISDQEIPVMITGETGTGKELIADAVQKSSNRSNAPYIKVNCGAIPDTLIDSELFGHEKGAFTGAIRTRAGRFEQADGGTLFLDEIGDMPLDAQVRLLRVLQDGIIRRVGGTENIYVDVRIIAATNRDLRQLIRKGQFREDLFYRLNVFPIRIPPLRERKDDIPQLIRYFIQRKAEQYGLGKPINMDPFSLQASIDHHWPGNIRELENVIERALATSTSSPLRLHQHIYHPSDADQDEPQPLSDQRTVGAGKSQGTLHQSYGIEPAGQNLPQFLRAARENLPVLDDVMADHIRLALQLCNGKIYGADGAGTLLNINPNTLRKRMDKLGIPYKRRKAKSKK